MALNSRYKIDLQFSMAGMTDIIFQLIIFFMLTSTLVVPNAIKLLLPRSNNQTMATPVTTVSITKDLRYYIETTPVAFENLEYELEKKLSPYRIKYNEDPTISLHAERSVPIEEVVKVMNIAKKYKYKIILATSPE